MQGLTRLLGGLFLFAGICMAAAAGNAASRGEIERGFADWLRHELWPEARAAGVSADGFYRALANVRILWDLPDLVLPGAQEASRQPQHQAEFGAPGNYFSERNLQSLAATGRALAQRHGQLLARIERQFGVPGHVLLAI